MTSVNRSTVSGTAETVETVSSGGARVVTVLKPGVNENAPRAMIGLFMQVVGYEHFALTEL